MKKMNLKNKFYNILPKLHLHESGLIRNERGMYPVGGLQLVVQQLSR